MTRIPSPRPDVPVIRTGPQTHRSHLLVIPDFTTRTHALEPPSHVPQPSEASPPSEAESEAETRPEPPSHTVENQVTSVQLPPAAAVADLSIGEPLAEPDSAVTPANEATERPAMTERLAAVPQLARFVNVATSSRHVQRLAKSLPKSLTRRTTFGWQRTVLLILGGAILAYGVTGGWRRDLVGSQAKAGSDEVDVSSGAAPEIHRMSRAPLRVERQERSDVAARPAEVADEAADDAIFHVPEIGDEKSHDFVEEAGPQPPAAKPANDYPVIGAPDGSKVSQQRHLPPTDRNDLNRRSLEAGSDVSSPWSDSQVPSSPWNPPTEPGLTRETIAERSFRSNGVQSTSQRQESTVATPEESYPRTDPATYRDPEYRVPAMANRLIERSH